MRTILVRMLLPMLVILGAACLAVYMMIEALVADEVLLRAKSNLKAEGEHISAALMTNYNLLFATKTDKKLFDEILLKVKRESLDYLKRVAADDASETIFVLENGKLILPELDEASAQAAMHFFDKNPCVDAREICLIERFNIDHWMWKVAIVGDRIALLEQTRRSQTLFFGTLGGAALLICIVLLAAVSTLIKAPLRTIGIQLDSISIGIYEPTVITSSSEFEQLSRQLNAMSGHIKAREIELDGDKDKFRKQMRMLESQVRAETSKRMQDQQIMLNSSRAAVMGEMLAVHARSWSKPINLIGHTIKDLQDAYLNGELNENHMRKSVSECTQKINALSSVLSAFEQFFAEGGERFSLKTVLTQTVELMASLLIDTKIAITLNKMSEIFCDGDALGLKQVLLNILINAKDAIVANNVACGDITIDCVVLQQTATIAVSDNGGGIPYGVIEHIFDPFFSTKEANSGTSSGGTGIGLYMAKTVIEENYHGYIEASSIKGGAQFVISIPIAKVQV